MNLKLKPKTEIEPLNFMDCMGKSRELVIVAIEAAKTMTSICNQALGPLQTPLKPPDNKDSVAMDNMPYLLKICLKIENIIDYTVREAGRLNKDDDVDNKAPFNNTTIMTTPTASDADRVLAVLNACTIKSFKLMARVDNICKIYIGEQDIDVNAWMSKEKEFDENGSCIRGSEKGFQKKVTRSFGRLTGRIYSAIAYIRALETFFLAPAKPTHRDVKNLPPEMSFGTGNRLSIIE